MSFRTSFLLLPVVLLLAGGGAFADVGDVFYVDARNALGAQDGLTWSTAFDTIEEGINVARENFGGEVWVAFGNYGEVRSALSGSLQLQSGVDIYGGFKGDETTRSQRDFKLYTTVIDGSHAANGTPASSVVDGASNTVLDGVTIQGGRGTSGTGMLNVGEAPVVRNCIFRDNEAAEFGGAVLNLGGSAGSFVDCTFMDNSAGASGGAVANTESGPTFTGCVFQNNSAGSAGGAMFNTQDSPVTISGCRFRANSAGVGGGAVFNQGAAISIEASRFIANTTDGFGGALFNNQSAGALISADTLAVNCVFAHNTAGRGGGAFANQTSSLTIINCTIADNTAPKKFGGAFFNSAAQTEVINSIIWYNSKEWISNLSASYTQIRWSNVGGGDNGANNISLEPSFVDRANNDYRLNPDSPSIDAGTANGAPATDFLGVARPLLDAVDQGAYESQLKVPADNSGLQCNGTGQQSQTAMPDAAGIGLVMVLLLARRGMRRA